MGDSFEIRSIDNVDELEMCETLQQVVWAISDREVVPVSQLRAAQHAGGLVAGAYHQNALVGFVYGFPARPENAPDGWGLHSHMLAVAPQHRRRGIGRALKWFQRDWCLARGFTWMAWTFDPLQPRNANLNLEHLGAIGVKYYRDFYGQLGGELAGDLATDRLLALWHLQRPEVIVRAEGERPPAHEDMETSAVLESEHGEPGDPCLDLDTPRVTIAAPDSAVDFFTEQRHLATRWREAHRAAFTTYFSKGYVATRFRGGRYHLDIGEHRQSSAQFH